jgi:uncharacterized protein (UPF0276 family)
MTSTTLGIGWRPELALAIDRRKDVEFVEVLYENVAGQPIPQALLNLRERGVTVIPHAVSMSLGGAERPNIRRIREWNQLANALDAPFVSEHIAFVRAGGKESGHLLPVPRTKGALKVLTENILCAREHLTVPLVLENIAMLCDWKNSEMDEAEFITALLENTGCLLLLDVANLYANSLNHNFNAVEFLKKLPLSKIAYVHTAGGVFTKGIYHDTHAHPVVADVHNLLAELLRLASPPRVMLERDDNFPNTEVLNTELDTIANVLTGNTPAASPAF